MSIFELSPYQKDIINYIKNENGNLLIDAKAGAGKTSTLLLISDEIKQQNKKCLFLAFNKHIVEELDKKVDTDCCQVKTIHALGLTFLRSYLYRKYGKNYKLEIDSSKTKEIVKILFVEHCLDDVKECNNDLDENEFKTLCNNMINDFCTLLKYSRFNNVNYNDINCVKETIEKYCLELKNFSKNGLKNFHTVVTKSMELIKKNFLNPSIVNNIPTVYIDFTDMVYFPAFLNLRIPNTLVDYVDYVLVDEAQDLSQLQQAFLKLLDNGRTRFIFVGDEKQAIYGFAGADTQSINNIKKNFTLKQLPLNICYRCPKQVIKLVKSIVPDIDYNRQREDPGEVRIIEYMDFLRYLKPKDIVLTRKNQSLVTLYRKLVLDMKMDVKFRNTELVNTIINDITNVIKGFIRLYNRNENIEIELVDKYYRMVNNMDIKEDCSETIIYEKGIDYIKTKNPTIYKELIDDILTTERCIKKKICKSNHSLDYLQLCMEEYKLYGNYKYAKERDSKKEYYETIYTFIQLYKKSYTDLTVKNFLEYLVKFLQGNMNKDVPIISTIHMMKGTEADNIFIYDYPYFPYFQSCGDPELEQQERNLQYVALTRAKKKLYLCLTNPESKEGPRLNTECRQNVSQIMDS